MGNNDTLVVLNKYREANNSFSKKAIFHVGDGAGFYSEVDAMMQCMLWCYAHQIKFILYADDANFSGGNGWRAFFEPFCEESHLIWNHFGNHRTSIESKALKAYIPFKISEFILRKLYHIDYLTQDIFTTAIDRAVSQVEVIDCDIFDVHGVSFEEFAKLIKHVMRYNKETREEIEKRINSLELPERFCSVQIRGGDKTMEYERLNDVDVIMNRVFEYAKNIDNLFVFTDDYRYVRYIKEKYQNLNVYTLTKEDECGYVNEAFQKTDWQNKKDNMIKLFSMVEICMNSEVHFGNEYTCVNQYLEYSRRLENKKCVSVWAKDDSVLKT